MILDNFAFSNRKRVMLGKRKEVGGGESQFLNLLKEKKIAISISEISSTK